MGQQQAKQPTPNNLPGQYYQATSVDTSQFEPFLRQCYVDGVFRDTWLRTLADAISVEKSQNGILALQTLQRIIASGKVLRDPHTDQLRIEQLEHTLQDLEGERNRLETECDGLKQELYRTQSLRESDLRDSNVMCDYPRTDGRVDRLRLGARSSAATVASDGLAASADSGTMQIDPFDSDNMSVHTIEAEPYAMGNANNNIQRGI
mmetsp:Transcript_5448/g.5937  ORF Transcript_5448/g.5937 Transcript_5448/m.5937 type:complete len:206 (+) Transcript_5448:74-691(+)